MWFTKKETQEPRIVLALIEGESNGYTAVYGFFIAIGFIALIAAVLLTRIMHHAGHFCRVGHVAARHRSDLAGSV